MQGPRGRSPIRWVWGHTPQEIFWNLDDKWSHFGHPGRLSAVKIYVNLIGICHCMDGVFTSHPYNVKRKLDVQNILKKAIEILGVNTFLFLQIWGNMMIYKQCTCRPCRCVSYITIKHMDRRPFLITPDDLKYDFWLNNNGERNRQKKSPRNTQTHTHSQSATHI